MKSSTPSGCAKASQETLHLVEAAAALMPRHPTSGPPFDYLKDVLRRLPTHPHRLVDQLTPRDWAKTFGPAA